VTRETARDNEDIQLLRSSTQELNRYIQNILRLTRIESEKLEMRIQPADLNVVAANVIQNVGPIASAKSIAIETKFTPLFSIEFDPDLIFEVIQNLVENAIKYSPPNTKIQVSTFEENDTVTLEVQDWGPGIPESEQHLIWNRFYRGTTQLTTKGTGLGLYLVKFFVERHGGSVFLISRHNEGTRIGFRLPLT
ncbi:MAG: HAMP domain-containing histidine kinase, partial [Bdellovibrionales bacterium]|nr:HAMP domain-containing histidine kinase [Bdellovibrionales bacterium]